MSLVEQSLPAGSARIFFAAKMGEAGRLAAADQALLELVHVVALGAARVDPSPIVIPTAERPLAAVHLGSRAAAINICGGHEAAMFRSYR